MPKDYVGSMEAGVVIESRQESFLEKDNHAVDIEDSSRSLLEQSFNENKQGVRKEVGGAFGGS